MPMVAPRLALVAIHALLHDRPFAVIGDEEAMQIEIETVLHGGTVDLGHEATGADQRLAVKSNSCSEPAEFVRCLP